MKMDAILDICYKEELFKLPNIATIRYIPVKSYSNTAHHFCQFWSWTQKAERNSGILLQANLSGKAKEYLCK